MSFKNLPTKSGPVNQMSFMETLGVIKQVFFDKASRSPMHKLPESKPDLQEFLAPTENLKFIWFGHSTLLVNLDGKTILIDPVFSDYAFALDLLVKRFQAPVLKLEELPPIDIILISHDHYDHLDKKTVEFFQDKKAKFIVPLGVGEDLTDWGIGRSRITELNWNENTNQLGISFTATPARHFSGRGLFDRNKTLWASWVVKGNTQRFYYSGDSGYGEHFKEIGKTHGPFDVTFIENGQYNERWPDVHMQPEETIQAHLDLNGKLFVPVHWGMFDLSLHHWSEPVVRTHKLAQDWDIPFMAPYLGQVVDIGWPFETNPWWNESREAKKLGPSGISKLNFQTR